MSKENKNIFNTVFKRKERRREDIGVEAYGIRGQYTTFNCDIYPYQLFLTGTSTGSVLQNIYACPRDMVITEMAVTFNGTWPIPMQYAIYHYKADGSLNILLWRKLSKGIKEEIGAEMAALDFPTNDYRTPTSDMVDVYIPVPRGERGGLLLERHSVIQIIITPLGAILPPYTPLSINTSDPVDTSLNNIQDWASQYDNIIASTPLSMHLTFTAIINN